MTTCIGEYDVEEVVSSPWSVDSTALIGIDSHCSSRGTSVNQTHRFVDLRSYVDAVSADSMLGRVNFVFDLNYKKLSEAMRVTRPTIYSWLDGETVPEPVRAKRLFLLYSLANYWWANAGKRMEKELRQCSVGFLDASVDDLIVEENLSVEELVDALDKLSHIALLVVHEKPSVATRLRKKGRKPKSGAAVDRDLR